MRKAKGKIKYVHKLLMGFGTLCIIIGIILIFGDETIKSTSDLLRTVINEQVHALANINQLHYHANQIRLLEVELSENSDYYTATAGIDNLHSLMESFDADIQNFVLTFNLKEDKKADSLLNSWHIYQKSVEQSLRYAKSMNMSEAREISRYSSSPNFQVFSKQLELISSEIEAITQQGYYDSIVALGMKRYAFLLISMMGITAGVIATIILSRSLSKRVLVLRAGALRLADGDMTTPIPIEGNDELADLAVSFNDMAENLCKTTTSIENLNQEITERKKVEETLRRSREQYKTILRTTMDSFWIVDMQGRFLDVNEAYCNLIGYNREELLSMGIGDIEVLESKEQVTQHIEQMVSEGGGRFETRHKCKDGRIVDVEVSVNSNAKEDKLFCFLRNITERRQAEQRQAELLKEVERANQELKEFAYAASHDLKAPLRGIRSLAGWISSDCGEKLDAEGREQLNLLIGRVDRMQELIDGILQYSKIGGVEEENTTIHLNELVPDIIDLIALPENIQVTIDNELPVITCGETQITQVFQNLLSNAVKYMDKPQGHIRVGCVEENGFWKFSIADNGPGIEKEYFEKIFEIFQTLSRHDDKGGTGIGLTLVKKIVALYGGEIWLESELGQGSTFYFTLPKQETEIPQEKLETNIVGERR